MDNWLKFQYHIKTELWGHRREMGARNGNTGASEVAVWEANPSCKAKALRGPNKSREAQAPQLSRKAAIVFYVPVP